MKSTSQPARVDRASASDLTMLATDHGPVPMNIGVVLVLDDASALDFGRFTSLMTDRIAGAPRLRQRLVRVPFGFGRPVWVDDGDFRLTRHLHHTQLEGTAEHHQVLGIAAELVCQRLDRTQPLWTASLVTGLVEDQAAIILVLHHVVADGLGGLALLGSLIDNGVQSDVHFFPVPPPDRRTLAADAFRERLDALGRVPHRLGKAVDGLHELGLTSWPKRAERISLNQPTGSHRRLTTVDLDLAEIVAAAHRDRCTVNDIVLAAVSGCLIEALRRRGEHPDSLVISVPIAARRSASPEQIGNDVGVVPVSIPTVPCRRERLSAISAEIRARSHENRGSSAGPLGLLFRSLGRLGLAQAFVDHQRIVHTFETNMRGPQMPLTFGGSTISSLVPIAVNPGNVGVSFDVLSYAGRLVVTVVADPRILPEQENLTRSLAEEFAALILGGTSRHSSHVG
ncbi:MAG: wax ester/triacylglycerol synthase domain-containing protein [Actinomycetes bacterium]